MMQSRISNSLPPASLQEGMLASIIREGRTRQQVDLNGYVENIVDSTGVTSIPDGVTGRANVELQGQTLQNLIPNSYINETSSAYGFGFRILKVNLQACKKYTFVLNGRVDQQALDDGKWLRAYIYEGAWAYASATLDIKSLSDTTVFKTFTPTWTGEYRVAFYLYPNEGSRLGKVTANWAMLLEGDYTKDIPSYFDGIKSSLVSQRIKNIGKNLFNCSIDLPYNPARYNYEKLETGYKTINNSSTLVNNQVHYPGSPIRLEPSTAYTISAIIDSGGARKNTKSRLRIFNSQDTTIAYIDYSGSKSLVRKTFVSPLDGIINVSFYSVSPTGANGEATENIGAWFSWENIQLEKGDIASANIAFENCKESNYYINSNPYERNIFDGFFETGDISTANGSNTSDPARIRTIHYIKVDPNLKYKVKRISSTTVGFRLYDGNKKLIKSIPWFSTEKNEYELQLTPDVIYIRFIVEVTNLAYRIKVIETNDNPVYQQEFRSLPNGISDTISSDLKIKYNVVKLVLDGSEQWSLGTAADTTKNMYYVWNFNGLSVVPSSKISTICDILPSLSFDTIYNQDVEGIATINERSGLRVRVAKAKLSTYGFNEGDSSTYVPSFKSWMSSNNLTVYCDCSDPMYLSTNGAGLAAYTREEELQSFGEFKVYPKGSVYVEPTLWGFNAFNKKKDYMFITTKEYPVVGVNKVEELTMCKDGYIEEVNRISDARTSGGEQTNLVLVDPNYDATYFYDCNLKEGLSINPQVTMNVEMFRGAIWHDYKQAVADWILTDNENKANLLVAHNLGGNANIISKPALGKMFTIRNASSNGNVILKSPEGSMTITIAPTKIVTVGFMGTNFYKVSEV